MAGTLNVRQSAWRPGRYELGNFARNLRGLQAFDANGNALPIHKISKDHWRIDLAPAGEIRLEYEYYAAQPDAGACWTDDQLLYVNPVHCCLYVPEASGEVHTVQIKAEKSFDLACALPRSGADTLSAENLDELFDSPFFASSSLVHTQYEIDGVVFHIWLHGECRPDLDRIKNDFINFTRVQMDMMGGFPVKEYHFLVLVLPYTFYHGVEHQSSTVLALGPGTRLMQSALYNDLMGVASHELFHAWNVKTLRPADFHQYDYAGENYSRLGWVYEGVTTYYGDLFLLRSGFFTADAFFAELQPRLQRHFDGMGCRYSSVAESSFDTWLDGYVPGAPGRKVSIYDEGALIALMLDLYILRSSKGQYRLDDLYRRVYQQCIAENKGYREGDFIREAQELSDPGVEKIFSQYIHSRVSYEPLLQELLASAGFYLLRKPSGLLHERLYGFRVQQEGNVMRVIQVLPGSIAETVGIAKDDELAACNGWKLEANLSDLVALNKEACTLLVFSQRREKRLVLSPGSQNYFDTVQIAGIADADPSAKELGKQWLS
jgi:predicted metalloprotease with PDZ domain